jgi:ribosomal protein S18 acetylase RimI-like enzyme
MKIRPLDLQSYTACMHVWNAIKSSTHVPVGAEWSDEQIAAELKSQAALGLWAPVTSDQATAASPGGTVEMLVGFCLTRVLPNGFEILLIAVDPNYQGRGYGRALLASCISQLKAGEVIWLEVHELNQKAISFYESCGFFKVGVRERYYSDHKAAWLYEYAKKS